MNMAGNGIFGNTNQNIANNSNTSQNQVNSSIVNKDEKEWKCTKCGTVNTGKFCTECGNKRNEEKVCPKCGNKVEEGQKFCDECGEKIQ